ncbi:MAG: DUF4249 domain-containing protein [Chitinophagaceae bacterium]|nr:DUF4249 domain-containing protein [Chitinophagaceae bacterium]
MNRIISSLLIAVLITGCEKNINFELKQAADVLVVDANIENGQPPLVILTHSLEYFSNINPSIIANTFVHNAEVTISNGTLTHRLKEYAIPVTSDISIYTYGIDTANLSTAFNGEFNTNYTLNIVSNGKEYHASTTIPILAKKPDSLWWKKAPFQEDTTRVILMTKASDPPGLGNYVRYFTKKNNEQFLPGENSVFDDQVIDGTTYELQVQPGIDRNSRVLLKDNYFNRGDTITLKLCNIDKATYTFWNTWEFAYQSIGNPFAQPNKVIGNISNGALGAFYGYAAYYKTLIVPR